MMPVWRLPKGTLGAGAAGYARRPVRHVGIEQGRQRDSADATGDLAKEGAALLETDEVGGVHGSNFRIKAFVGVVIGRWSLVICQWDVILSSGRLP